MNEADFSEISRLSEKYNKDPKSRIFVQLADVYRKKNMVDEALDVLNKGLEYHPQYPVAYLILGKCHYDKRSYIQARDAFEKTIALDPHNVVALRMLAKTCEVLKDETGQINAYKSIISIDPLDTNAKDRLSMLEAIQRKEPLYTVAMAEEHEKQNNLAEALKIYEHLLYTDPSDLILNQKVTELKKKMTEEKRQLEEEGIEELQIEKVFKTDELVLEGVGEAVQTPQPSAEGGEDTTVPAQNEVQSLEDFLVEELEQAAEKEAAQPSAEGDKPIDEKSTEEILLNIPEPVEPADLKAVIEDEVEEPPATEVPQPTEPLAQTDTIPGESETAASPVPEQIPEEAVQEPPAIEVPQPTEPLAQTDTTPGESETAASPVPEQIPEEAVQEPPAIEVPQPTEPVTPADTTPPEPETLTDLKTAPEMVEKTETPEHTERTVVPETQPAVSTEPPAVEPLITAPPEKAEPPEAKAETEKEEAPKKSKEEDFKSFQEWLSGLLK